MSTDYQSALPPSSLAGVHVVINSYGRDAWYVERAVNSTLRQKLRPESIQLIDQNHAPLVLSASLQAEPLLTHHHHPEPVCSHARNFGATFVPSEWIAFLDDDAYWTESYSEKLVEIMRQNPEAELIAGSVYDEATGQLYSLRQRVGGQLDRFSGSKLLTGANFLVNADLFTRVGGYDPRLGPGTTLPSSEEADLCWRLLAAGARAVYAPEVAVLHPPMHVGNARSAACKAYRYGLGKGALAAIWLIEKRHVFGLFEFIEMTVVPFISLLRGLLRGDMRQLLIQPAQWWGRQQSFWTAIVDLIKQHSQ